jgi:hypothetical protein
VPNYWSEKPLDFHHYRIVQGPDAAYYDAMLYRTTMARVHNPEADADGLERRQYRTYNTTASAAFLDSVCNVSGRGWRTFQTTDCKTVVVPFGSHMQEPVADAALPFGGCDLYFDANNRLVVEKSRHVQAYVKRASKEDRQNRAEFLKERQPLLDLIPFIWERPDVDTFNVWRPRGSPFQGRSYVNDEYDLQQAIRRGTELTAANFETFRELVQAVGNTIARRRDYDGNTDPVTVNDVTKSVKRILVEWAGLHKPTELVPLPMFMASKDFPSTTFVY